MKLPSLFLTIFTIIILCNCGENLDKENLKSSSGSRTLSPKEKFDSAYDYYKAGDYYNALETYKNVIRTCRSKDNNLTIESMLAIVRISTSVDDFESSYGVVDEFLKVDHPRNEIYYLWAWSMIHASKGDHDESKEACKGALAMILDKEKKDSSELASLFVRMGLFS